ncbi:hypothetical protein [Roseibium aggregatum]|uniref:hypothetical protein n=1 Tax=Roseibium aggregatum TaxID=187304 RepID=UPI001E2E25F6|nr:hypothetical protein [Roseibium aggregatum]UES40927.1 hypothetical protein GFC08_25580 [Roseibium aggregatum]
MPALEALSPTQDGAGGLIWASGDPAVDGIYSWDLGTTTWTRLGALPIAFSALENIGGTANSITADVAAYVAPGELKWAVFTPLYTNTLGGGEVIDLGNGDEPLKNGSGADLVPGDLIGGVTTQIFKDDDGNWRQMVSSRAGATMDYQGDWDSGTTYTQAQFVAHDNKLVYLTAASSTNEEPGTGSPDPWLVVVDFTVFAQVASQAEAEAATDNTKTMTPLRVGQAIDGRASKLFGADSIARTIPARFGDTLNLREWFDVTGGAGTATANDTAFAALITYLGANPTVRTLVARQGDVIRIGGGTQRIFPAGTRLVMEGSSRFESLVTLGSSSSDLFYFTAGCITEGLEFNCLDGSAFRRLIGYVTNNRVYDQLVTAETQINNQGASPLLDFCVRYFGQDQKVFGSKIVNVDKGHFVYGDGGDGDPMIGARLYGLEAESYVTGIDLRNLRDAKCIGASTKTRSSNATQDPGHNAIVHEGVFEYELLDFSFKDAGEHGARFGGTRNSEQSSGLITVGNGSIYRSGQCGLKFFTGTAGQVFERVNVGNVNVVDCQYEPENPSELPGFNDEGFLFQQMRGLAGHGLSVSKQSSTTGYSCDCGIFITTSEDINLDGAHIDDPYRNAIRIAEFDDGAGSAPVETTSNNGISIKNVRANAVREHGIFIDHPTQSIRDLTIEADLIGSGTGSFYAISGNGAAARYAQPCLFELKQRAFTSGISGLPGTANIKTRDRFGSTY